MRTKVLTVTEAVRNFSEYISRVAYRQESFILHKGRKPVAELRPLPHGRRLGDLPSILRAVPHLSRADVAAFAKDVDAARTDLAAAEPRNPWES